MEGIPCAVLGVNAVGDTRTVGVQVCAGRISLIPLEPARKVYTTTGAQVVVWLL